MPIYPVYSVFEYTVIQNESIPFQLFVAQPYEIGVIILDDIYEVTSRVSGLRWELFLA